MGETMRTFNDWIQEIQKELIQVSGMLGRGLPDEPHKIIHELTCAESWYARIGYFLAEANAYLDKAEYELLPAKESMSELERKASVKSSTSDIRAMRNRIEALYDGIKTRIGLGQSLLAYHRQSLEADKSVQKVY